MRQKNWLLERSEKMNNYLAKLTLKEKTQKPMSELKGLLLLILQNF